MRLRFLLYSSLICALVFLVFFVMPRRAAAVLDSLSGAHSCASTGGKASRQDRDHVQVRQQVQKRGIVPLRQILTQVASDFSGDMIEVRFEDHEENPLYEVRLLAPDGVLYKLYYNAVSMTLIKAQGRGLARWYKGDRQALLQAVCPSVQAQLLLDWEQAGQTQPESLKPHETKWWQRLQGVHPHETPYRDLGGPRKGALKQSTPSWSRQKNTMEDHHACSRD